mgnify:CR=1 FL=1
MRVLLVEDDPLIGNGLQIGLTKSGFIVDWFTDGQSGLNALIGAPYDAVVLDLTLPKLDGLEVLKQWRSNNQDVPVLILTARWMNALKVFNKVPMIIFANPLPWRKWLCDCRH